MVESTTPFPAGTVLAGKYRVDRTLGAGGMGVVVAATHLQLGERVALKFLLPEARANAAIAGRFLREARTAVRLKSEHVARVHDVGALDDGAPFIVMELLEGRDLAEVVRERGPMSLAEVADVVIQACDALAEAHSLGMVHRDLKPANLFVTKRHDGSPLVKVLDFGISKSVLEESAHSLTRTSDVMGSPHYMAPEQMKSAKDVDARADVWSIGVILYELLSGRVPFDAPTLGGLMAKVFLEPLPDIAEARPDLPREVCDLVTRALEREVAGRVESVAKIVEVLAPFAPPSARVLADRIVAGSRQAAALSATIVASGVPSTLRTGEPYNSAVWGSLRTKAPKSSQLRFTFGAIAAGAVALVLASIGVVRLTAASRYAATNALAVAAPPATPVEPTPVVTSTPVEPTPVVTSTPIATVAPIVPAAPAQARVAQRPRAPTVAAAPNPADDLRQR